MRPWHWPSDGTSPISEEVLHHWQDEMRPGVEADLLEAWDDMLANGKAIYFEEDSGDE